MRRAVIVGGGEIERYERIREELRADDYFIYCDAGLFHEKGLNYKANLIVGDFDSSPRPEGRGEVIVLPREKDDTDTLYGVKEALKRGYKDFLLLGMTGRRTDHTLANLYILSYLEKNGARGRIIDDWCEMEIVGQKWVSVPDTFPFFSVISWRGESRGVYIRNAKYPLQNAVIEESEQYGVSNEPLEGGAEVRVLSGSLLLIKDYGEA